eukprot:TRINITY_DN68490_c0_g1_i1.p1 TRINITY_DN68490_c0_g1~~TRINITY_DN68490_c0_g1_i1.p1  ORF type:complete len:205 (+),score=35.00 TRINITY_DN68490_c0_g1_i1:24-638(+)
MSFKLLVIVCLAQFLGGYCGPQCTGTESGWDKVDKVCNKPTITKWFNSTGGLLPKMQAPMLNYLRREGPTCICAIDAWLKLFDPCPAKTRYHDPNFKIASNMSSAGACPSSPGVCGQKCLVNTDCSKHPGPCAWCMSGVCGAGCMESCAADSQCLDQNCQWCSPKAAGGKAMCQGCWNYCTKDSDCKNQNCRFCTNNQCHNAPF